MNTITLTINDKPVKAEKGASILKAAREAGIEIPTLCSHEKLLPQGGCRLCTVELLEGKRTRLVASCAYIAEEGLKVRTESDQLSKGRKMIIELLMARAPGVQELQEYAIRYGAERDRFETEPTYCILCGLCVRYCAEVKKKKRDRFYRARQPARDNVHPGNSRQGMPRLRRVLEDLPHRRPPLQLRAGPRAPFYLAGRPVL